MDKTTAAGLLQSCRAVEESVGVRGLSLSKLAGRLTTHPPRFVLGCAVAGKHWTRRAGKQSKAKSGRLALEWTRDKGHS